MPVSSRTLRRLAELKLSPEQMSGVLGILADQAEADEERLANQRERKRRSRSGHGTVTGQSQDKAVTNPPPKESSPTPPKEITPSRSLRSPVLSPREVLATVVGDELAGSIIEHRQKLRKPMTYKAAELLVAQLAKCRDPTAAANEMLLRGWQSVKPSWMDEDGKRDQQNGGKRRGAHDTFFEALAERSEAGDDDRWGPAGPDERNHDDGRDRGPDQGRGDVAPAVPHRRSG